MGERGSRQCRASSVQRACTAETVIPGGHAEGDVSLLRLLQPVSRWLRLLRIILGLVSLGAGDDCHCVMDGVEGQVTAHLLQDATPVEGLQHPVWGGEEERIVRLRDRVGCSRVGREIHVWYHNDEYFFTKCGHEISLVKSKYIIVSKNYVHQGRRELAHKLYCG